MSQCSYTRLDSNSKPRHSKSTGVTSKMPGSVARRGMAVCAAGARSLAAEGGHA